ncbi:RNA-binding protein KhpA, partial [Dysosmobacter welbionis]
MGGRGQQAVVLHALHVVQQVPQLRQQYRPAQPAAAEKARQSLLCGGLHRGEVRPLPDGQLRGHVHLHRRRGLDLHVH